jgi:hypothetical protein
MYRTELLLYFLNISVVDHVGPAISVTSVERARLQVPRDLIDQDP